jgi:prophage tail gpP-like protein
LLDFKVNHFDVKRTLAVINLNIGDSDLIVVEYILWEMNSELHESFVTTATEVVVSLVNGVLFEGNWSFVDHQKILVSDESFIMVMNFCHDGISDLNLWFL